jgi:IclR family transcriptional regulator, pca regulon regulatory protein
MSPRISAPPNPRRSLSLEYGAAILECFTATRPVLRNSEIASMVGISRATTSRYLATLVALGHVEQDSSRRYLLANHAAQAGMTLVNTVRREIHARAVLEDLRDATGHTVSMGLLDGARVLYVYRLHAHGAGQYDADGDLGIGAHVPAHNTAVGKALLSTLIDSELRSLLTNIYLNDAEFDTAVQTSLTQEIERVRRDGIAVIEEHDTPRARSIATPVTRWLDKPILAVTLTAPAHAYPVREVLARFGEPLRHAAKLLSA